MGGRLLDWLGAGAAAGRPLAVDMPALVVPASTALYYQTDTGILSIFDPSGPTWFDIDVAAISAFTTESLQDMIAAFLVAGTGITMTYNDAGNQLTVDSTITQYTDENAMDAVAAMFAAGAHTGITVNYNDAGDAMSLTVTLSQYTDEMAQDAVANLIAAGVDTGLAIVYNDAGNLIGFTINVATNTDIWGGTVDDKFITPKRLKDWRTPVSVVDAATITLDGSAGANFYVTLGGSRILANPTNFNPGQFGVIHVTQDGTGTRLLTFGANWKFGNISIAGNVLSVTAGATDAIHYYVRADGTITCFIVQNLTGSPARLALDNLSNVNISSPANGDVLTYDTATSKWKNAASAGGGSGFGTVDVSAYNVTGGPLTGAVTEVTNQESGYGFNHASSNITTNDFWFRTRAFSGNLTILTRCQLDEQGNGDNSIGLIFRESGATKFVALLNTFNSGTYCEAAKSTNDGASHTGVGTSRALSGGTVPMWMKAVYVSSTNTLTLSVSLNGVTFTQVYTGTTDVTPNQVGFCLRVFGSTTFSAGGAFKYWSDPGLPVKWNLP